MKRILRLHPSRGFYMHQGLHLMNPEKPFVELKEGFQVPPQVVRDIEYGTLIDVNKNIVVDGKATKTGVTEEPAKKTTKEAPKEVAKEAEETEAEPAKGKKTTKAK